MTRRVQNSYALRPNYDNSCFFVQINFVFEKNHDDFWVCKIKYRASDFGNLVNVIVGKYGIFVPARHGSRDFGFVKLQKYVKKKKCCHISLLRFFRMDEFLFYFCTLASIEKLRLFIIYIFRVTGAVGDGGESAEDKEKNAEAERERLEAIREAEERRKEKHRKMEEEREKMRQEIRDKVK